jgi:hypothetical protein
MSAMLTEIRAKLEQRAADCESTLIEPGPEYADTANVLEAKADAFRESAEIVAEVITTHTRRCTAIIWHGPGHQSKTTCEVRGPHEVHYAIYGEMRQEAEWRGDEVMTGFFDEPPEEK